MPSYFFSVTENAPIGYWIGDVSAVDEDKTYNKIFYKIQNFVSNSIFHVSNQNGSMTLKKSLDRETNDKYIFTLVAFNKDQNGNESLKSSVEVYHTTLFFYISPLSLLCIFCWLSLNSFCVFCLSVVFCTNLVFIFFVSPTDPLFIFLVSYVNLLSSFSESSTDLFFIVLIYSFDLLSTFLCHLHFINLRTILKFIFHLSS